MKSGSVHRSPQADAGVVVDYATSATKRPFRPTGQVDFGVESAPPYAIIVHPAAPSASARREEINAYRQPMSETSRWPVWVVLGTGILITMVALVLGRLAYGLILPSMRANLGLGYGKAADLASASALGYVTLVMLAGALAARRGGRFTVALGITTLSVGFAGMALSSHYALLMAFMLMLGIGTAFSYTPAVSLLAGSFPERRGMVIGLMSSGVGIGMLAVGLLVPRFDSAFGADGWRWVWASFAVLGGLCIVAVLAFMPRSDLRKPSAGPLHIDAGRGQVFRNRRVITVGVLYAITGMIYIMQATFMYSFALESGVEPAVAGVLAASMGLLSIPAGPLWGVASDRIGRGRAITITLSVVTVATLAPVVVQTLWAFAFHYAVMGMTVAGLFTSILAAASEEVEPRHAPLAVSYVTFFFACGQLFGPFAAGLLIEHGGGFRGVFGFAALLMSAGVLLAFRFNASRHGAATAPHP